MAARFTMEQDFYTSRLRERHGIEALIPDARDREVVHRIIYDELCLGIISQSSKQALLEIMDPQISSGANGHRAWLQGNRPAHRATRCGLSTGCPRSAPSAHARFARRAQQKTCLDRSVLPIRLGGRISQFGQTTRNLAGQVDQFGQKFGDNPI